jgi:hypothetical protein
MSNTIVRLQSWFLTHCVYDWENDSGVSIESTDNPGWWVKIDLRGTELEHVSFIEVCRGNATGLNPVAPWVRCYVDDARVFNGGGDPTKLEDILNIFLDWADSQTGNGV